MRVAPGEGFPQDSQQLVRCPAGDAPRPTRSRSVFRSRRCPRRSRAGYPADFRQHLLFGTSQINHVVLCQLKYIRRSLAANCRASYRKLMDTSTVLTNRTRSNAEVTKGASTQHTADDVKSGSRTELLACGERLLRQGQDEIDLLFAIVVEMYRVLSGLLVDEQGGGAPEHGARMQRPRGPRGISLEKPAAGHRAIRDSHAPLRLEVIQARKKVP